MGHGFKHGGVGGGAIDLNFEVIGGTTAPSDPKENTIWVNTDTAIHTWNFSPTEPTKRSGNRNLIVYPFDVTSITAHGVSYSCSNGSVTAKGTATASAYCTIRNTIVLQPGTYTLSGCPSGGSYTTYRILMQPISDGSSYSDIGNGVTFTLTKETEYKISCWVGTAAGTVSNLVFKPQLEKGSSATSFIRGDAKGQVWITINTSGIIRINTLKKNGIWIYLINVKQATSTSWENKTGKIYLNDAWTQLVQPLTVVPNTTTYGESAWTVNTTASDAGLVTKTVNSTSAFFEFTGASNNARVVYIPIDVTLYSTMTIVGTLEVTDGGSSTVNLKVGLFDSLSSFIDGYETGLGNGKSATINNTYDISSQTGTKWFGYYYQVASTSRYYAECTLTSVVFS